jgi:REP element-mobilizing transposase RayT
MHHFQSNRLRIGRFDEPSRIYSLTGKTHERRPVFSDWKIGRLLVHEFTHAQELQLVEPIAWVVMPDHFHWLIELRTGTLADVMRRVKSRSAKAVNYRLKSNGRVWQSGFHDRAIRREEDLKAIARYIVLNPVRAGLVDRIGDYPLWDAMWL